MTTVDLLIRGGNVVSPESIIAACVAIKDGRIIAVGNEAAMPHARENSRRYGMHVLPGAIDVHVHFRDPGYPHKEDFASGTAAAAFGGVTTVFDMPNTIPPTGTAEILAAKHHMAAEKAHVDFGLYGLLGEDTIAHVPALVESGVVGFKLYMGNTFGKIPSPSTGAMLEAFEVVAPTGKRISLHAETNSIMERRETRLRNAGRTDTLAHIASRPSVVAVEAVSRAAILAEWTGRAFISSTFPPRRSCVHCVKPKRVASISPARPARTISCFPLPIMRPLLALSASIRRCARRRTRSRCGALSAMARSIW